MLKPSLEVQSRFKREIEHIRELLKKSPDNETQAFLDGLERGKWIAFGLPTKLGEPELN